MSNADNYMAFAYYVNRCWDHSRAESADIIPCELELTPTSNEVWGIASCKQVVEVATVKFEDRDGNTLKTHMNLGDLVKGRSRFKVPVDRGNILKFFYEFDCAIFEGAVEWESKKATIRTEQ